MRVRAIERNVPGVGGRGVERNIDSASARVLILLGKVERVGEPSAARPKTKPKKARTQRPKAKAQAKAKTATAGRTYKRRDMVPEPPPETQPTPAPVSEPVPEPPAPLPEAPASEPASPATDADE